MVRDVDKGAVVTIENKVSPTMPVNPYGGTPGGGIQFPPYYTPTPSVKTRNNYFPNSETIGADGCASPSSGAARSRRGASKPGRPQGVAQ